MKAICWHGTRDVRCDTVPDPILIDPTDVILRVTATAICGSDLHLYNGLMPTMEAGDILGHETMGVVTEVGRAVRKVKVGDRVVVPFTIACGNCFFCSKSLFAACDTSNPPKSAEMAREAMGASPAAMFGYSHMLGGIPGGQAEYLRVPHADVGLLKIESDLADEQVLFLSDIFPTGFMAAENAEIEPGDTVAVWGCGPVGQFTIQSAWMLGAGRVIAIDREADRLRMAQTAGRAEVLNFDGVDVQEALMEMTDGRGPDRCIDAVGTEAHGSGALHALDKAKTMVMKGADRAHVLREVMMCCRKAGTISIPGVYLGMVDELPFGAVVNKGLTIRSGQTHVQRYMRPLLERISNGEINPAFVITDRAPLEEAPAAYEKFLEKADGCVKVVLKP